MTLAAVAPFLRRNWFTVIALALIGGFLGIHAIWYIHPSDVESIDDLNARLTNGEPTVVEFYTNL